MQHRRQQTTIVMFLVTYSISLSCTKIVNAVNVSSVYLYNVSHPVLVLILGTGIVRGQTMGLGIGY